MNPLERLIKGGENQQVEFLASEQDVPKIAGHIVAFLNGDGGRIFIGVGEKRKLLGVDASNRKPEGLEAELRGLISPKALFSVTEETIERKKIWVVEVPGGRDKPFVVKGKVFIRKGARTVSASGEDLQSLFQKQSTEAERWERRGSPVLEIEDLDEAEIRKTFQAGLTERRFDFKESESNETVLHELGLQTRGMLTNAADVCFGLKPAIRNPQVRLRAYAYQSEKTRDEYLDQADISGPLALVLNRAINFVQRNSALAAQFLPDSPERKNIDAYPDKALREGLVNALAHRDYSSFSSGLTIQVYPARLEIWNSGKLPDGWNASKLRHNHPSIPPNPDIAHFLYIRGLMERIGRGTLKMIEQCREADIPAPTWRVDENGITLTLFNRASQSAPITDLNDRQVRLIQTIQPGNKIALREYVHEYADEVSERQAQRDLKELMEADLLRLQGRGRSAVYVRTDRQFNP